MLRMRRRVMTRSGSICLIEITVPKVWVAKGLPGGENLRDVVCNGPFHERTSRRTWLGEDVFLNTILRDGCSEKNVPKDRDWMRSILEYNPSGR
jgi:hypothetical protein